MNSKTLHTDEELEGYTRKEILQIQTVFNLLFFGKKTDGAPHKKLVLTGGYPGAGKSRFAYQYEGLHPDFVRVDINDTCLLPLPGYQRDYSENGPDTAYEKWRAASHWIFREATKKSLEKGYNLLLVSTATSPGIFALIADAREKDYGTELHGFTAPEAICLKRNDPKHRLSYLPDTKGVSFSVPDAHMTGKRPLFDAALPDLVKNVGNLHMHWNPVNYRAPSTAFRCIPIGEEDSTQLRLNNPSATLAFMKCAGWIKEPEIPILPSLATHLGLHL